MGGDAGGEDATMFTGEDVEAWWLEEMEGGGEDTDEADEEAGDAVEDWDAAVLVLFDF